MKQIIVTLIIVFTTFNGVSQEYRATKACIHDFAVQAYILYKFGNGDYRSQMNHILIGKGYSASDAAIVMENLETDTKGREAVLEAYAHAGGDQDTLFHCFYSLEMSAKNANDLSGYVYDKYMRDNK